MPRKISWAEVLQVQVHLAVVVVQMGIVVAVGVGVVDPYRVSNVRHEVKRAKWTRYDKCRAERDWIKPTQLNKVACGVTPRKWDERRSLAWLRACARSLRGNCLRII